MQIAWLDYTVNDYIISIEVFDQPNPLGNPEAHGIKICFRPKTSVADVLQKIKELLAYVPNVA